MTMASTTESASRIPVTLRRSSSLRLKGERCYQRGQQQDLFPAITENADAACHDRTPPRTPLRRASSSASLGGRRGRRPAHDDEDDGAESVRSFGSSCSGGGGPSCEHAHFALNGTTWSARARRYVVHRSPQPRADEAEEYLTPTQRSARQLRHSQALLREARAQLEEREREVARLTKELVEMRLRGRAEEEAGPREAKPALVDSGLFEAGSLDELQRRHLDETQQLKQAHHERLEGLLGQLAEMSARHCLLEREQARARRLEDELERLREQLRRSEALLADQEERNKRVYLEMYAKGQEAASAAAAILDRGPASLPADQPKRVSVAELLRQLTVTRAELDNVKAFQDSSHAPEPLALACRSQSLLSLQEAISLWVLGMRKAMYRRILESRNKPDALDPEITLQFLKSAVYYFLTDKENLHGHLNAIESILGFTDLEKLNIDKLYRSAKK